MIDVIVIGGGPSGAMAAQIAAEQGLSTLLIEKHEVPRIKPCGGEESQKKQLTSLKEQYLKMLSSVKSGDFD